MKKGHRNGKAEGIFEVNMTPLIDVSLVLVVILMVATPMAYQSSIAVRSAAATGKKADLASREEWVEISVVSEDSVLVNRTPIARAQLEARVRTLLNSSPKRQVVVRCAENVSHGAFVGVLDAARRVGAVQIAVMGR